jgi:Ni/Co efflux regulator RcnB
MRLYQPRHGYAEGSFRNIRRESSLRHSLKNHIAVGRTHRAPSGSTKNRRDFEGVPHWRDGDRFSPYFREGANVFAVLLRTRSAVKTEADDVEGF